MERNFPIFTQPTFTGNMKIQGQVVPLDDGYLTHGFIAGATVPFGSVVRNVGDNKVVGGVPQTTDEVCGIAIFDQAIANDHPAYHNSYLEKMPMTVLMQGFAWFYPDNVLLINRDYGVYAKDATGEIVFSNVDVADATLLNWIKIGIVDERKKRVLVLVDIYCASDGAGGGIAGSIAPWAENGSTMKIPMAKLTGLSENATTFYVGLHDNLACVLHGNSAYIGEPSDSGDNEIITKSEVDILKADYDKKIADLTAKLTDLTNKLNALATRVTTAEGNITTATGTANTAKSTADSANTKATTANTEITALKAKVSEVEGTANTAKTTAETAKTTADTANGTANTNKTNITALTTRIGAVETSNTAQGTSIEDLTGQVAGLEADLTTANGKITTNTSNITSLTTRVTALEGGSGA